MASTTEAYLRNSMRPALRRQFQNIALRIIAEGGARQRLPGFGKRFRRATPESNGTGATRFKVLADNDIITISGTTASFVEQLDAQQFASLLSALDERAASWQAHGS